MSTASEELLFQKLGEIGAIITNSHIVYTSGKHGSAYVNKDAIYPHTDLTSDLCLEIAEEFSKLEIDTVIAPAIGGVILSQWVAHHLTRITGKEVFGVYSEKEELTEDEKKLDPKSKERFVIKRGYDKLVSGKRILVVEDVLNTGGSVQRVIEAVRLIGGNVIGLAALCNRGDVTPEKIASPPVPIFSLLNVSLEAYDEAFCPLCSKGVAINTQVGKGKDFLRKNT